MKAIKVRSKNSKNIPCEGDYIIREGKEYHAFTEIYGHTFHRVFSSLHEAGQWLRN